MERNMDNLMYHSKVGEVAVVVEGGKVVEKVVVALEEKKSVECWVEGCSGIVVVDDIVEVLLGR